MIRRAISWTLRSKQQPVPAMRVVRDWSVSWGFGSVKQFPAGTRIMGIAEREAPGLYCYDVITLEPQVADFSSPVRVEFFPLTSGADVQPNWIYRGTARCFSSGTREPVRYHIFTTPVCQEEGDVLS